MPRIHRALISFDPEIEKTERALRKQKRLEQIQELPYFGLEYIFSEESDNKPLEMGDNNNEKPLRDYAMSNASGASSSIVRPTISPNNFELRPALIQIIQQDQFSGLDDEDPNEHITTFLEKCDTVKLNGVTDDVIRLGLFPFSLKDKAKMWLKSNPPNSFTTWATLSQAFLSKYFPSGKTAKFRNNKTSFFQLDGESLYEAWERFKDLQRKYPHHGVPDWLLVQTFYNGLNESVRITIDTAAGGAIMGKTTEVANRLLEEMASNNYHWSNNRGKAKNAAGMYEVEGINMLNAKVDNLVNLFTKMSNVNSMSTTMPCNLCGGAHLTAECANVEQAQYVSNFNKHPQNDPYSNTYNPGWRNHPNFSRRNSGQKNVNVNSQHQPGFHQKQPQQEIRPSWELATEKLANATSERIEKLETKIDQIAISNRNVELQLGQLATAINSRNQGALPSKTEVNPKQHCNAVTLRNGKELSNIKSTMKENEVANESEKEKENYETEKDPELTPSPPLRPYVPPIPFPQRLKQTYLPIPFPQRPYVPPIPVAQFDYSYVGPS
ncbi:uncharacterized protein LOC125493566 [Beta vulgaris subsp. vulgaris]|uniref:uncharacterized protein LOC125493566 n=1 Tax=Beta vulgaris subsp. vulgaris TaxID=3555 RepID=UPI0020373DC6|nr:uncharacterized protein LOC125493566 [Beta vulgaris subsp. vulgaris]